LDKALPHVDRRIEAEIDQLPLGVGAQRLALRPDGIGIEAKLRRRLCQRQRMEAQRAEVPEGFVVGDRAARRQVPPSARLGPFVHGVAKHPRQLLAHLELLLEGDGSRLFADVVGVVERGQHLGDHTRQQQVRIHVPHVSRAEEWHGTLQLRAQHLQLAAHPRDEFQILGLHLRRRRDRSPVLRMEVLAPVGVIAHELEQQVFEETEILGLRTEEERIAEGGVQGGFPGCRLELSPGV
jgi:hypothetical protein